MFARPGPFPKDRRSETEHPIAGSLPAVNLFQPAKAAGTELFKYTAGLPTSPNRLALAELEALAGALLPVLLAFLHARIARQKAVLAQAGAQLRIEDSQRARKPHAYSAGLPANTTAIHRGDDVHRTGRLRKFHGFDRAIAPGHIAKI